MTTVVLRLAIAALLAFAGTAAAAAEKRVALVIGNSAYRHASTLKNAGNDARLMADTLSGLGFSMVGNGPLIDADRPAMEQAIRAFGRALRGGAVGMFYYSGHGMQIKGTNYIIPVTAKVADEADVKYELVDVGFVLDEMANAGNRLNLVILDACRNNPLGGKGLRSAGDGLATMTAPAGTAIGFATQPGNVARDGSGGNSPYTAALAQVIRKPGLDLFDAFNEVGLAVKKATGGAQQPWLSSSPIEGAFYFAGRGGGGQPDNSADLARAQAEIERLRREAEAAKAAAVEARRQQAIEEGRRAEQERLYQEQRAREARRQEALEEERREARRRQAREEERREELERQRQARSQQSDVLDFLKGMSDEMNRINRTYPYAAPSPYAAPPSPGPYVMPGAR